MSKLDRVTLKKFGLDGSVGNFGQFGSLAASSIVTSKDPATIQALAAWGLGLSAALVQVGDEPKVPAMQDINGVLLVAFYELAYILQAGMPEWDAGTTYYANSFCQVNGTFYRSKTNGNIGNNPVTDATNWESAPNSNIAGALYGGVPQNNNIDPTFRIDFSACQGKDSTGVYLIDAIAMTKNVTATWAAGSGQGGLDTGTIGSSAVLVYFFAIDDSTGVKSGDYLMSKSYGSPVLPSGYNLKRFLGARRWNGTSWDQFVTVGNGVQRTVSLLNPQTLLTAGAATDFADVSATSFTDLNSVRLLNVGAFHADAGNAPGVYARTKGSSAAKGNSTRVLLADPMANTSGEIAGTFQAVLNSSGIFQYALNAGALNLYLRSFEESL